MLIVVRIDAETGNEAVHHQLHVGALAARPPPKGFGWIEEQGLMGQKVWRSPEVTDMLSRVIGAIYNESRSARIDRM